MENCLFDFCDDEIFLITSASEGRVSGMIVTSVMRASLSDERPRVLAALSPHNFTTRLVLASRKMIVHLLAADQVELVTRFGLYSGAVRDKFEGLRVEAGFRGIPRLAETCGWLEVEARETVDCGDRIIVVGGTTATGLQAGAKPLRVHEAFAAMAPEITRAHVEKYRRDRERDLGLVWQG